MGTTPQDRVSCRTLGCPNTIQPATALRNGGYCGPCAGKRAREAREAFIRANRKDVDRYANVTDSVELLRLMHTPPRPDPLVNLLPPPKTFEELYLDLSSADAVRLFNVASEILLVDEHQAEAIAKCLAAFTTFNLGPLLNVWLDHGRAYPALIFRGAGSHILDRLEGELRPDTTPLHANHVLSALAWVGGPPVVHYFQNVSADKPKWAKGLNLSPGSYARVAGWEIDEGTRRELTYQTCYGIHVAKEREPQTSCVRIMQCLADPCPWCGTKLTNLLEVDFTKPAIAALPRSADRIEVLTCPICTCFTTVYAELDAEGHGHWASENSPPAFLPRNAPNWEPSPWANVDVRLSARLPTHGADWCLPTTLSQIGGFPAWVQDASYPFCPGCGRTMIFIAQIDQAAFPSHEGVYYAFYCEQCRITATTYQQT